MAAFKDYYETLGVAKDASQAQIKRAFRKLAVAHHPDRNPDDPEAEERFKEANEAYTALSDPEKRKIYDTYGSSGRTPPQGDWAAGAAPGGMAGARGTRVYGNVDPSEVAGFSDFFQSLFGADFGGGGATFRTVSGAGGSFPPGAFQSGGSGAAGGADDPFAGMRAAQAQQVPADATAELKLDLMRAFEGGEVPISVGGRKVTVSVPAGVRDGAKLRLRGQAPGGGDLILVVRHEAHPDFAIERDDVRTVVRIPDHLAALGGTVRAPTLGGPAEITVPAGSSSGRVLRLRGQGWPKRDGGRGDQRVELRVTVPDTPSDRQNELYRALRDAESGDATPPEDTASPADTPSA